MGSSRLTKKELKNRTRSASRLATIKRQGFKPVIKAVDIEQIKQEYQAGTTSKKGKTDKLAEKS